MALKCIDDSRYQPAIQAAETYIRNGKMPDGSFGNEYTTGLAIQVGFAEMKSILSSSCGLSFADVDPVQPGCSKRTLLKQSTPLDKEKKNMYPFVNNTNKGYAVTF